MIGRTVRRLAGPLEPWLADVYRAIFFDVDAFARRIAALGEMGLVLEIGCGEGALITAMARRMTASRFVGIDLIPQVGRLFDGDASRVEFACCDAEAALARFEGRADLVIICDVMHHASDAGQQVLWRAAARMLKRPGGRLILKEWLKNSTPIYYLGYASDRFITGDRIRYELRRKWVEDIVAGQWTVEDEWSLPPWRTNHAFVLTPPALR